MKSVFKLLLLALVFVTATSGAKDGPFPMREVVGIWKSPNQNLELKFTIIRMVLPSKLSQPPKAVIAVVNVMVRAMDTKKVLASGVTTHSMEQTDFKIDLLDVNKTRMRLVVNPEYTTVNSHQSLELKMDMIELDTATPQGVPKSTFIRLIPR